MTLDQQKDVDFWDCQEKSASAGRKTGQAICARPRQHLHSSMNTENTMM